MDCLEIIQLKPYTGRDREVALAAFNQLIAPIWNTRLREINMCQSLNTENELSILINWHGELPRGGKSGLGLQLARAFAEFGYIYHSGWRLSSRLLPEANTIVT